MEAREERCKIFKHRVRWRGLILYGTGAASGRVRVEVRKRSRRLRGSLIVRACASLCKQARGSVTDESVRA